MKRTLNHWPAWVMALILTLVNCFFNSPGDKSQKLPPSKPLNLGHREPTPAETTRAESQLANGLNKHPISRPGTASVSPLGTVLLTEEYALLSARITDKPADPVINLFNPAARLDPLSRILNLTDEEREILRGSLSDLAGELRNILKANSARAEDAGGAPVTILSVPSSTLQSRYANFTRVIQPVFPESAERITALLLGSRAGREPVEATLVFNTAMGGGMMHVTVSDTAGREITQIMLHPGLDGDLIEHWSPMTDPSGK